MVFVKNELSSVKIDGSKNIFSQIFKILQKNKLLDVCIEYGIAILFTILCKI